MESPKGNHRAVAVEAEDVAEVEEVAVEVEAEVLRVLQTDITPQKNGMP